MIELKPIMAFNFVGQTPPPESGTETTYPRSKLLSLWDEWVEEENPKQGTCNHNRYPIHLKWEHGYYQYTQHMDTKIAGYHGNRMNVERIYRYN